MEVKLPLRYAKLMEYRTQSPGTQVTYSPGEDVSSLLWIATTP
jgi:hypothetical protein